MINAYVFRKAIPKGENNGVLGHHKIVLNDKGLIETMSVNETFHSWKSVERIEQSDEYIFIYIGPSMAHFIPKRFFADRGDAERFFAVAQSYKKAADKGFPQLPRTEQGEDEFSPVERMIRA